MHQAKTEFSIRRQSCREREREKERDGGGETLAILFSTGWAVPGPVKYKVPPTHASGDRTHKTPPLVCSAEPEIHSNGNRFNPPHTNWSHPKRMCERSPQGPGIWMLRIQITQVGGVRWHSLIKVTTHRM